MVCIYQILKLSNKSLELTHTRLVVVDRGLQGCSVYTN